MMKDEPHFKTTPSKMDIILAFNWYAENYSWKQSRIWQVEFLRKASMFKLADYISNAEDSDISWVAGWICRMISNGSKLTIIEFNYLQKYLEKIESKI
jgi:hypothetical protein